MRANLGSCRRPSMAEVTEIGGVIIPSASSAAPPIIAGATNHFRLRLTNVYKENIPPSPLLSALKVKMTYLKVVCSVKVQKIQEMPPNIRSSLITRPLMIALKTYSGDVPMSP